MSRAIDRNSDYLSAFECQRRKAIRIEKGRPPFRTLTRQYRRDSKHYPPRDTVAPDPILDLHVARIWALTGDPRANLRYGELVQRVVSPLDRRLP